MGVTDHLTCLLQNLYAGQEATWSNRLVPNRERSTSRLYIVTLLFNLYAEYIMSNSVLDEAQAGIKMLGEISVTSVVQMTPPLLLKEELKSLLIKVKEEGEKFDLKLNIQKLRSWHLVSYFMANSWKQWKEWQTLFFVGEVGGRGGGGGLQNHCRWWPQTWN